MSMCPRMGPVDHLAVLPGGYVLAREVGTRTPVRVRRIAAGGGFEQLRINER
jgi:hypothetical protein